jgi:acetyltransferase-like isoleucine patch superfamily enzyme
MAKAYKVSGGLSGGGGLRAYQELVLGTRSLWFLLKHELIMLAAQNTAGALGLWLRQKLFPLLLGECGPGCLFGRGVGFRHPGKIRLGAGVVLDDGVLVDAKGRGNRGVSLGEGVYVGRGSIIYTKDGDIELAPAVNVSANCELFSGNRLSVGRGTVIAAYSYLLSGGEYEYESAVPLAEQAGDVSRGETRVGANVWIAAHAVVADGSVVGDGAVIAAGAVVRGEVPADTLAAGVPARAVRAIARPGG